MENMSRSGLFILKQFGFSDRLLIWLYMNSTTSDVMEFLNYSFNSTAIKPYMTKKDMRLAQTESLTKFVSENRENLLNTEKNKIDKILFKYDQNVLDKFMTVDERPLFFYLHGRQELLARSNSFVAIIGTRKISSKYFRIAQKVVQKYIQRGFITVSGLAKGTDTIVHTETLKLHKPTIAVLPTNFVSIYPKENKGLAQQIFKHGLAITSIGPLENTYRSSFLERNRYVALIADEVVVIETNFHSGTMNTVHAAKLLNKRIKFIPQEDKKVNEYLISLGAEKISVTDYGN